MGTTESGQDGPWKQPSASGFCISFYPHSNPVRQDQSSSPLTAEVTFSRKGDNSPSLADFPLLSLPSVMGTRNHAVTACAPQLPCLLCFLLSGHFPLLSAAGAALRGAGRASPTLCPGLLPFSLGRCGSSLLQAKDTTRGHWAPGS